jgi:hypothetical protein
MSADVLTVGKNQYKLIGTQNIKNNPNSWINKEVYLIQQDDNGNPLIAYAKIYNIEKTWGKIQAVYFDEDERDKLNLIGKAPYEIKVHIELSNQVDSSGTYQMYFYVEDLDSGYLYTLIEKKRNKIKDKLKMELL